MTSYLNDVEVCLPVLDQGFFRFIVTYDTPMFLSRTSMSTADGAMLIRGHDDGDGFTTKAASVMSQRGEWFDTMSETAEAT